MAGSGDKEAGNPKKRKTVEDSDGNADTADTKKAKHASTPQKKSVVAHRSTVNVTNAKTTDGQVKQRRQAALLNNPPGVRAIAHNLESSLKALGSYLGFTNTQPVKDWLAELEESGPLAKFHSSRRSKYGMARPRNSWPIEKVFATAFETEASEWLRDDLPLDTSRHPREGDLRGFRTWVITMDRIIVENPQQFPGEPYKDPPSKTPAKENEGFPDEDTVSLINGHTAEDWHRAYWVVKASIRRCTDNRQLSATGTRSRGDATEALQCLTIDEEKRRSEAAAAVQTITPLLSLDNNGVAELFGLVSGTLTRPQETDSGTNRSNDDDLEVYTAMEKSLLSVTSEHADFRGLKKANPRHDMTADEQSSLCTGLAACARILSPRITAEDPLVPTTKTVDELTARCLAEPSWSVQQRLLQEALNDEEAEGSGELVNGSTTRQDYHKLQEQLNAVGARPPPYLDACDAMGLDPAKPVLPFLPNTVVPKAFAGVERVLKPWQVQGQAWCIGMALSHLKGFILSDEMGLGKTLSGLAFLLKRYQITLAGATDLPDLPRNYLPNIRNPEAGDISMPDTEVTVEEAGPVRVNEAQGGVGRKDGDVEMEDEDNGIGDDGPGSLLSADNNGPQPPQQRPKTRSKVAEKFTKQLSALDREINEAQELTAKIKLRKYLPTLIVVPSQATGVWKAELARFMHEMHPVYFLGDPKRNAPQKDVAQTLDPSINALLRWILEQPDHPAISLRPILTSYTTWANRSLYRTTHNEGRGGRTAAFRETGKEDDDLDLEDGTDAITAEQLVVLQSFVGPGVIRAILSDESQKLKDCRTQAHVSIKALHVDEHYFLTATSMINRTIDLHGLLDLVWNDSFLDLRIRPADHDNGAAEGTSTELSSLTLKDYEVAKVALANPATLLSADNIGPYLYLLDPRSYSHHMLPSPGTQVGADVANTILPVILTIFQLRRTMSSRIEGIPGKEVITIGEEIPPARWTYVEIQADKKSLDLYRTTHKQCEGRLTSGLDEDETTELLNMTVHRRLCQAVTNPDLDQFFVKARKAINDVESYYHKGSDHGATHYFHITKPQPDLPAYKDHYAMSCYIALHAPKLRVLAGMVHDLCNTNGRKVLLFTDWPLTQWCCEMFLTTVGFNVIGIRATNKQTERDECVRAFNDPNSNVQVLVTSMRISATAINLHHDCSDVIFVDCPSNAQNALQGGGRAVRLGQTRIVHIWVLTMDHSYDQTLSYRAEAKMLGIIAGQGNVTVTDEDRDAWRKINCEPGTDEDLAALTSKDDFPGNNDILTLKAAHLYMQMFGLRCSRHNPAWGYTPDVTLKDRVIPSERHFRRQYDLPSDLQFRHRDRNGGFVADPQLSTIMNEDALWEALFHTPPSLLLDPKYGESAVQPSLKDVAAPPRPTTTTGSGSELSGPPISKDGKLDKPENDQELSDNNSKESTVVRASQDPSSQSVAAKPVAAKNQVAAAKRATANPRATQATDSSSELSDAPGVEDDNFDESNDDQDSSDKDSKESKAARISQDTARQSVAAKTVAANKQVAATKRATALAATVDPLRAKPPTAEAGKAQVSKGGARKKRSGRTGGRGGTGGGGRTGGRGGDLAPS